MGGAECFLRVCFSSMRLSSHSLTGVLRTYNIGGLIRYGQEQYLPSIIFLIHVFSPYIMILNLTSIQHEHVTCFAMSVLWQVDAMFLLFRFEALYPLFDGPSDACSFCVSMSLDSFRYCLCRGMLPCFANLCTRQTFCRNQEDVDFRNG